MTTRATSGTPSAVTSRTSREQVLHLLAEAAELEHNILCSYLYAAFSLKQREDEGVTTKELEAISRWRADIMGLCVEEMVHLAQVCNLMVAMGSRPHFNRPNFPVAPGYHPAGVAIALAPFSLESLEHFIFLERPEEIPVADPACFQEEGAAERPEPFFRPLMPRAPDYETIGGFYDALRCEIELAAAEFGERRLFSGPVGLQLTAKELRCEDLVVVRSVEDARRAILSIVEQGEGSGGRRDDSHFGRFESIRGELLALRAARPEFEPARDAARDPVMHAPVVDGRVWIENRQAAHVVDAANGAYSTMLRCLAQLYETPAPRAEQRRSLLGAALSCMKAVTALGSALTELPARDEEGAPRAGMSFAMLRAIEGPLPERALSMLAERLSDIAARVATLGAPGSVEATGSALADAAEALRRSA
ncbi:ferritin-like protein [Ramlibacter sp. AN1015]|uniref:ferritin-like domain-containing protein n=1 Tax=Ramlibacter sp. AN1015 TaxID=3133428 RepID=UPI0030BAB022